MGAEAFWVSPERTPVGVRCSFCARLLDGTAHPAHMSSHCDAKGCRWCRECAAGETTVSPLYPHPVLTPPAGTEW